MYISNWRTITNILKIKNCPVEVAMPRIPEFRRLRKEGYEFEISLG
jgi:hypothetical protein